MNYRLYLTLPKYYLKLNIWIISVNDVSCLWINFMATKMLTGYSIIQNSLICEKFTKNFTIKSNNNLLPLLYLIWTDIFLFWFVKIHTNVEILLKILHQKYRLRHFASNEVWTDVFFAKNIVYLYWLQQRNEQPVRFF